MTYYEIFDVLLQVLVLIIGGLLVPYIKIRLGEAKYDQIISTIDIAVGAAEQIYKSLPKGDDKDMERYKYVVDYLQAKGIKLKPEDLHTMIEDAVLRLNGAIR